MVKLIALLYRREGTTHEEFLDHWRNSHGPLIASLPNLSRHLLRDEQHARSEAGPMSGSPGCDGVTEQWFNSIDDFIGFCSEPDYQTYIAPDEQRFLDMGRVQFIICEEPTVVLGA